MESALEKSFMVQAVHNRQDGGWRAVPDGLHDIQFQRRQHCCEAVISIISRAASFPGACDGIDRMRKVIVRRGNRMEMMSPTRTSRPAFASWPFTATRPASQVSLARLRRKITRLHFKNKSRRIGSIE